MHLVVDADARLASLQRVGEAADLQHQQVDRLQHLLAVDHTVSQALQLAVAHRAREGAREAHSTSSITTDIIDTMYSSGVFQQMYGYEHCDVIQ